MGKKAVTSIRVMKLLLFVLMSFAANQCDGIVNDTVYIGVIVDSNSWVGKVAMTAIKLAVADVNRDKEILSDTRLLLHRRHSQSLLDGAAAAFSFMERQVVAIIGGQTFQVSELLSNFGDETKVPIVSFTPGLSTQRLPYFVQMERCHGSQMKAIAAVVKAYGWRQLVFILSDEDFGSGVLSSLGDALKDVSCEIVNKSIISSTADKQAIREELYKLKTMDTRVFVAHIPFDVALRLFAEAEEIGMMSASYVWMTTDRFTGVWDMAINVSTMKSLQGLLGLKIHVPNSDQVKDFTRRWKLQFKLDNPGVDTAELNLDGLLAYDTVLMIARAIGNLGGNASLCFQKPAKEPLEIGNAQIKVFQQGKELLQEIIGTNFVGLSGPIQLGEGEIDSSSCIYEIVNVVGKSYQTVGYWTDKPSKLSPTLAPDSSEGLGPVIWPGRSNQIPRGWVIQSRLKIAVPVKPGWKEMVRVTFDPARNESIVTGFCKDVFDAALQHLPYALPYDLYPYPDDGNITSSYNDLIEQVQNNIFDGALGDFTTLAYRSKIVEFTESFSQTGVVMVVLAKTTTPDILSHVWQTFTPKLWATIIILLLFEAIAEKILKQDSGGNLSASLWDFLRNAASLPTEGPSIKGTLGKIIEKLWMASVCIICFYFTTGLNGRLEQQRAEPSVRNVEELVASGVPVGYQNGSFVADFLYKNLGIAKRNLKAYETPEEYAEALLKGSDNGGVAAIFDEIPYIRVFLSGRCGYTIVEPIYKTGSFGFIFPKGSPFVSDISSAILALSEDTTLREMESEYWNTTICTDSGIVTFGLDSCWWLFLPIVIVTLLALLRFFCTKQTRASDQDQHSNPPSTSSEDNRHDHHSEVNEIRWSKSKKNIKNSKKTKQAKNEGEVWLSDSEKFAIALKQIKLEREKWIKQSISISIKPRKPSPICDMPFE